jgi:exonuclease SbcC
MKINRIRLHPFAGIIDDSFEFDPRMNVMLRNNEFGKSTLFNAIKAVLFYPVNTSLASADGKILEDLYPHSGTDHISVTIELDVKGKTYVLSKTWSRENRLRHCSIIFDGTSFSKPDIVEQKISELLVLNRASWEHMLFIPQTSLARTIEQLKAGNTTQDILRPSGAGADGFDALKFEQKLIEKREALYQRWDALNDQPENGRGIGNRWAKAVGLILAAYYDMEELRVTRDRTQSLQNEAAALEAGIVECRAALEEQDAVLKPFEALTGSASRRSETEGRMVGIEGETKPLRDIQKRWNAISIEMPMRLTSIDELRSDLDALNTEQANAEARQQADQLLKTNLMVLDLRKQAERVRSELKGMQYVSDQDMEEARACEKKVRDASLQVEAQQLKVTLRAASSLQVRVTAFGEKEEPIDMGPGQTRLLASAGSIRLGYGDLTVDVQSGNLDIDELNKVINDGTARLKALLASNHVQDIPALIAKQQQFRQMETSLAGHEMNITLLLQGKTSDEWDAEVARVQALPSTRPLHDIRRELSEKQGRFNELNLKQKSDEKQKLEWEKEYGTLDELGEKLNDLSMLWRELDKELKALPALPPQFSNGSTFIEHVDELRRKRSLLSDSLSTKLQEKAGLEVELEQTGENLAEINEKLRQAELRFAQRKAEAEAVDKILMVTEEVRNARGSDPYREVRERMINYLGELTDRKYTEIQTDQVLPSAVVSDRGPLRTGLLSKGMLGSLAMAVRLAFAQDLLKDMDGFMLFDDPFTELDPGRRQLAAKLLARLAKDKQVIFMTCHPEHSALFEDVG